ncbi:MAG: glutamine-hydrolyzing carbamoyl-phosphate synthase small subunit [Chloroflexota bacterium]|nr:glutamine-hydrolyzing carbamoyl-phosphate synthase small subunit [Chloroflexota bacterium]
MSEPALLVLEDGRLFHGETFGAPRDAEGEVVFSTSMTGYQEMCTDPSYHGQILCLTYPLVGNYGVSALHDQSTRPWVSGLVVRQHSTAPSHWGSSGTLGDYLRAHAVPGISGVDTRALTRHIRAHGSRRGIIVSGEVASDLESLVERARNARLPSDLSGVADVSGASVTPAGPEVSDGVRPVRAVVIDCGLKTNILNALASRSVETIVVPYSVTAEEVLALAPDGVITSPGPGDPEDAQEPVRTVGAVLERDLPFFGICLGHQILGLAIGATTSKLKFGHRGGNHPVKEVATGRVRVTSQNHGYQVDAESVPLKEGWRISHYNVNDDSVEGLVHTERPAFSVQYHPEGSPGPEENAYLFDAFVHHMQRKVQGE